MSKRNKKKEEPVVPEKYIPENLLENLTIRENKTKGNQILLNNHLKDIDEKYNQLGLNHIKTTQKIFNNINEKERENAVLNEEIRDIRD